MELSFEDAGREINPVKPVPESGGEDSGTPTERAAFVEALVGDYLKASAQAEAVGDTGEADRLAGIAGRYADRADAVKKQATGEYNPSDTRVNYEVNPAAKIRPQRLTRTDIQRLNGTQ